MRSQRMEVCCKSDMSRFMPASNGMALDGMHPDLLSTFMMRLTCLTDHCSLQRRGVIGQQIGSTLLHGSLVALLTSDICLQMTGYCTTWSGEGDAAAGTRQAATEIDFHTDIDEDGVELVRETVLPITALWKFVIPLCCRAMQQSHVPRRVTVPASHRDIDKASAEVVTHFLAII